MDCVGDDMIGGSGMGGMVDEVEEKMMSVCKSRRGLEERKRMRSFGVVAHPFIFFLSLFLFVDLLL